eukprot:Em0013g548a
MQPCSHPGGNAVATNNISVLVNKYRRLRHLLIPLDDLCKIVSYIRRWQNFFHSSCAVMLLTLLSLNLSIFLSVVTVSFCVVMAIGYYHQYTSSAFARRLQVLPHVSYINQDQTHEEELQKEQKANEDDLLEFQYLLNKSQEVITTLNGVLEHVYGVALWQHRVQSICVSLFLSALLVVIYADLLHIVFGCWAIIAFCFNTHFAHSVSDTWKKALESRSVGDAHPVVTTGAIHTAAVTGAQPTMAASAQSAAPASSSSPTAPTSAQATATPSSVRQATATPSSVRKRQTTPTVPVESSGDMSDGEEVQTSGEGEQGRGKQPGDPPRATVVAQDDEISVTRTISSHHWRGIPFGQAEVSGFSTGVWSCSWTAG